MERRWTPIFFKPRIEQACIFILSMNETGLLPPELTAMVVTHMSDKCYACCYCKKVDLVSKFKLDYYGTTFCNNEECEYLHYQRRNSYRAMPEHYLG